MKDDSTKRVFQKMRAMIDAMIKEAKQVDAWNAQHGIWEVPMALQLYESVIPLFEYPTTAGHHIRRNAQMSWRTVYNIYTRKGKINAKDLSGAMADETGAAEDGVATLQLLMRQVKRWIECCNRVTVFFSCFFHRPRKG